MKKTLKTILSLAFALLLVFQFAGSMDAYAASEFNVSITGGSANDQCTVKCGSGDLADWNIASAVQHGVVITPAEGVDYVASVTVAGVDMKSKLIATESNVVRISGEDIEDMSLTAPVDVIVTLATIAETDSAAVTYDDGEASISSTLTEGAGSTLVNQAFIVPDLTADAKNEALREEGREFAGWELTYANGASMEAAAGTTLYPYLSFTLTAQWNSVDAITIRPVAQTKVYDGSAALVNDGSKVTDYEVYIYENGTWQQAVNYTVSGLSFAREEASKNIADVGSYTFTASGATVKDANGNTVQHVFYDKGTLTITERPITIKANDTTVEYSSEKLYPSGVAVTADSPSTLVNGHTLGDVTYDRFALRASAKDAGYTITPTDVVILDENGKDVSDNYAPTYKGGVMEVTKRKITVEAIDTVAQYDGAPHSIEANVTSGQLGVNDTLVLTTNQEGKTEIGKYENFVILGVDVKNSIVNESAANSYEITWDENNKVSLEIVGHLLKLKPKNITKVYDGTPLTATEYEIVEGSLMEGHSIYSIEFVGSVDQVKDVYEYSNIKDKSVVIHDSTGADVTASYSLAYERGTLRIEPIIVYITAGSNSDLYSGKPLTPAAPGYSYAVSNGTGKLLDGHSLVDVVVKGSQTYVGSSESYIESYDIVDAANSSVLGKGYYKVITTKGTLEVKENPNMAQPETVTVSVKSLSKTYDGKPLSLSASDYTITDTKGVVAAGGYELKVTVDTAASITDAGSTNVAAPTVEVYKNGSKVTDYPFVIETKGGTLTVNKLVVTLTAASASKKYDGKALTCAKLADGGATVGNASGKLVDGHTLNKNDIVYQGSQTNVGSSANKIISATIRDANGNSVNKNYQINFIDGVLTVTSAAGTGTGTVAGGAASGDTSNIGLWIAIMAVLAVAAAAVAFIFLKKKKADQ